MNKVLYDFWVEGDVDYRGRTIDDMIAMSFDQLEKSHDVIQWMFPLNEPSNHNKRAPLMDDETRDELINQAEFVKKFNIVCHKFCLFLDRKDKSGKPVWVTPHNHNYLRITRAIKCSKLLGSDVLVRRFYDIGAKAYEQYPDIVGDLTKEFWDEALGIEKEDK